MKNNLLNCDSCISDPERLCPLCRLHTKAGWTSESFGRNGDFQSHDTLLPTMSEVISQCDYSLSRFNPATSNHP